VKWGFVVEPVPGRYVLFRVRRQPEDLCWHLVSRNPADQPHWFWTANGWGRAKDAQRFTWREAVEVRDILTAAEALR
jgi:hypothetical protein